MSEYLIELVSNTPHWLATFLLSLLPVAELRLAIPVAITSYDMNVFQAFAIACIGNMLPIPFIILFIRPIFAWLKNFRLFKGLVEKLEARGNAKKETVLKYEFWGLVILVAIPLPGTGAWTGALVAGLMDMRFKSAIPAIFLGVIIAGVIVTLATTGVLSLFGL